jgi:CheY-like chemotaxis protein
VKADPGQIEQVIMNLAVNSRDAMPSGGDLSIKTCNVLVDEAIVRRHSGLALGPYAMITVTDAGIGMDLATQAQVFEPFFTTKEQGKGIGLGLATVYGIVIQSGGFVSVHSELGRGTTFKIYLPQVAGMPETVKKAGTLSGLPAGSETILIVEDEESVRVSVRRILSKCGYSTLEARDGSEALELFAKHPDTIDLVITDVVMPEMGGRALADALLNISPGLKMIFMSGYTEDAVKQQGVLAPGSAFIEKPFTLQDFAKTVRETLDAPSATPALV